MKNNKVVEATIKSIMPSARDIRMPEICGSQKSVCITDSDLGKYVHKFSHRKLALKNALVAGMLNSVGVPVPRVGVYEYHGNWVELYPFVHGKTLYECVGDGMPEESIRNVYGQLAEMFARMDKVNFSLIDGYKYSHVGQVTLSTVTDVNNAFMGNIYAGAVWMLNRGRAENRGLYHCGMTPKNVVMADSGRVAALVDMDEVAIADKNYAFSMMAAKYQQFGFNISDLMDVYENISGHELNRRRVKMMCDITNFGKRVMWAVSQHKNSKSH